MAAVVPNPDHIHAFATEADLERWLSRHHADAPELWIKIHKKGSGLPSVTPAQAIDVALCWGWIDGIRKSFDAQSFLQRYCPRRGKSVWSVINTESVARLEAAGRMTPHGRAVVDAAKADGRWDRAYAPARTATIPDDLAAAIAASERASAVFEALNKTNRFALVFRLTTIKTEAGRAKRIAALVAMLERGETPHPKGKHKSAG